MYNDDACASPCLRFVKGTVDDDTDMIQCGRCGMWFVDSDPTADDDDDT